MCKRTEEYLEFIEDINRDLGFEEWLVDDLRTSVIEGEYSETNISENANYYESEVWSIADLNTIELAEELRDYIQLEINKEIDQLGQCYFDIHEFVSMGLYEYIYDLISKIYSELELDY
jgi:hypothetical protein